MDSTSGGGDKNTTTPSPNGTTSTPTALNGTNSSNTTTSSEVASNSTSTNATNSSTIIPSNNSSSSSAVNATNSTNATRSDTIVAGTVAPTIAPSFPPPLGSDPRPTTTASASFPAAIKNLREMEPASKVSPGLLGGLAAAVVVLAAIAFVLHRHRRRRRKSKAPSTLEGEQSSIPYHQMDDIAAESPRSALKSHRVLKGLWLPVTNMVPTPVRGSDGTFTGTLDNGTKVFLKSVALSSPRLPQVVDAVEDVHLLRHPSINSLLGVALSPYDGTFFVATEHLTKGSLGRLLMDTTKSTLSPTQKKVFCADVAAALAYLHNLHRPYGTLHSGNVLLGSNLEAKLNGHALMASAISSDVETYGGATLTAYLAPELLAGTMGSTTAADVYAFGVLCGEIVTRTRPHAALYHAKGFVLGDLHLRNLAQLGQGMELPYDMAMLAQASSPAMAELIVRCWAIEPHRRPTMADVVAALAQVQVDV
ncbi:Aste57867_8110 [Aphanomyces stellatus]|uniref:Aste57867_8110 protein n=1 Tax=Aphanomyces stellatus TaxID=120398 RepID=A0A485KJH3_9STRA|nr:hypothetical protein As57867_008080 [Aphanomyces stellatus]VFT84999.1 Aste57867_8110 [Aphanomyces stellatus]